MNKEIQPYREEIKMYTINNYIDEFGGKLRLGFSSIKEAAEIYVKALQKYSFAQRKFEERFPEIKKGTWDKLKAIGTHKLISSAMLLSPRAVDYFRSLPIKIQSQIDKSGGVDVAMADRKVKKIPFGQLSDVQCDIVIDKEKGRVRSIQEQLKIVNSLIKPIKKRESMKGYVVNGCRITFFAKSSFTIDELKNIVKEMEKMYANGNLQGVA